MAKESDSAIRIVLLDKFVLVRAGLKLLIANEPGMVLIGETGDFDEALRIIATQKPDIILFETSETGNLGLEIIPQLIRVNNHARLILVTLSANPNVYIKAVKYGALGVVLKTQPPEVLLKAIRKVHAGEAWLDRSMVASVLISLTQNQPSEPTDTQAEAYAKLNKREQEIVQWIGQGLDARQIASRLFISESTVRHSLTSIYESLGVSGRLELLIFAYHVQMNHSLN